MPVNSSLSCSCQFIQSTLGASIEIVLQTDVVSLFAETISFAVHHLLVPNGLGFLSPPVNIKVSGREAHLPQPTLWCRQLLCLWQSALPGGFPRPIDVKDHAFVACSIYQLACVSLCVHRAREQIGEKERAQGFCGRPGQARKKAGEGRAGGQSLSVEQGHEGLCKRQELLIESLQRAFPADGVAEEYSEKIDDLVVPEATASKAHLRVDGRKDALFAKRGDDQRYLLEPGRSRGHRLGRGLDIHRDIGDTSHVYLLVGNSFDLPHQGGIFLISFAIGYISLRNSWVFQLARCVPFSSWKCCLLLLPQPPPMLLIWRVRLQIGMYATNSPGPRDELDRPIGGNGEPGSNALSQGTASLIGEGHCIARSRPLTTKKREPVVIKIAEDCGDVEHTYFDRSQPFGVYKHLHEWLWLADGEALPFIKFGGGRIERNGCVPKVAHQLHLASVVPDVHRNCPPHAHHWVHFSDRTARLGHKVEHESSDDCIIAGWCLRQGLCVSKTKTDTTISYLLACER